MTPANFVRQLASVSLSNVFNPYSDRCPVHDLPDAAKIRQGNLLRLLEVSIAEGVRTMWVGRDLGYLGGRRTGIALTDEVRLPVYASHFNSLSLSQATEGAPVGERTAGVTWDMLSRIGEPIFLWNAFPLHPHDPGQPFTNRCHTRSERHACRPLFLALIELLRPSTVVTIGNDASTALLDMGIPTHKVRHPSYGGKADFISGMNEIYGLSPEHGTQHELLF